MHRLAGIGERAGADPDGVGLVDDAGALTWAQVAEQVDAVGGELLAVAPGIGDRVAVVGENVSPTLVAHAAGILAGVGTVAVSRQLTAAEMADQFRDAGVVAVVTGPAGLSAAAAAAREAGVGTVVVHGAGDLPEGTTSWADWTGGGRRLPESTDRPASPPLVYTSGTTGKARGTAVRWAPSTVTSAAGYAAALAGRSGFPDGPHLVVGPLQHNGPLTSVRHLLSGGTVVVLGRFDAERVLQLVERHGVTSSVMVPTHFSRLLALPPEVRGRYDVSSLSSVAHTGSACPPDVKRAMIDWFGPVLVESYGGSEIGTVCRITSEEWLAHPGSVGRVVEPFQVVVLDEEGRELGPGEVGVLGFRTPPGREVSYHADAEKTRSAYVAPGVATLGDVGYVTADGFVHITDRVADMVVSGGVNLYPAESEKVLLEHPQVADVAVIGVPDRDLGEALRALVVARDPAPGADELAAWCRERLASYKCPKGYELVDALPRNVMGKLDKRALRRPYWDGDRTIAG
ncbi:AMP-binding protein [Trujillonella humicola]|uniref:AMP-binding protein n=1 Tax=Trujillonella humicola TaxID=3383699 RepID=UPI003906A10B